MTQKDHQYLLNLARKSIGHYLEQDELLMVDESEVSELLKEKRGCFVTLTLNGQLRGCIGHIEAIQSLYLDVIDNARNAAFEDPRFYAMTEEEFSQIKIELSVLSEAKALEYKNADDLLKKLRPDVDGVIIQKGINQSTFLPQVWEDLKKPEDFLSHLCSKAYLDSEEWKKGDLKVKIYQVEKFEE